MQEDSIMQITSRFTIAVHIITAVDYFGDEETVTSSFLDGSIGSNPVIVRSVMSDLKKAGLISISQGKSGISLSRPIEDISFYDIYKATECVDDSGLFHFHDNPNMKCPVGRNIHRAMSGRLKQVQDKMEDALREITAADVVNSIKNDIDSGR